MAGGSNIHAKLAQVEFDGLFLWQEEGVAIPGKSHQILESTDACLQVLLGDMGTGKTSIVLRFVKGQYFDCQESTIGAAFFSQILSVSDATIKFDR
ncbi:ras-related protein RABF2a-like [Asparagus officinalis]|uniref:ras-related protein RABF2a-like n=1 Tax=Asparagus officinalis TaxID=4686 RepID=UPI00098E4583|nr:ras-related protein RABF2a-like [Asparagus officinalis]XP_020244107.1 ras-related protein RABF2a-like [Asparagus officinalis]XP_020244108.1 ras-related protein RABF2a-like [Asparagus officinalis]XP_020244109.1 ras-related protein RABF2a-like [Asparagus officinalis]XP_020244110.1 ras-related protein RABF2a-like [Asparagus officinalis]